MIRGIGLRGAIAVNVITMVGIGPLITIPLVLADLHGSSALWAWVAGAAIALCDGLAWAELGSLFPRSGGTYGFLREGFGRERWGKLFGFLFAWQIVLSAPLVLASGYIGFAHYAGYLYAPLGADTRLQGIVAAAVGIVTLVALYRPIHAIGRIGIVLAGVAVATLGAVIAAAATHFDAARALSRDSASGGVAALAAGLGPALVITLYDYYGYGQSCTIGDEVRDTKRVLPRSVIASILGIALLYVALQFGVLGVVSWHELVPATVNGTSPDVANYVASTVVERTLGTWPARIVTVAILLTAFASTFGNLLGYSRIPFAAAEDGVFLAPFAKLDARGRFPNVSLVAIGLLAIPACFLSLGDVINALVAGLVIVQGILQLVAVVAVRARGVRAPYRMTLYPLPLVVALLGWTYIFFSAGTKAIAFGFVSLAAGCAIYAVRAARAHEWPFRVRGAALVLALLAAGTCGVSRADAAPLHAAPTWGHARIVLRNGEPEFEVDRKPFFLYGAAFFYERLPRDRWKASMLRLSALGINTLDIYVPWNWHELADGDFDFDGRTSPRRDLREVLRLAKALGFEIVLRPGPVIRNEWRNGGYPAWLLARPEYGMPEHDILEGRYPATATLQNQHSDDAAAEWMRNATHMTYAKRWLERVLHECAPVADRILAVALDDDQGAYIDNQTYPAPHFQAYLGWLRDTVHGATGPRELTFINTYQMKVTASSPVWAMGNWYQSDAYALGEHDRAQLEFSTGLLHTRPGQPMMASEFQAGWLEQPDDVRPRPADPSNTALALGTMLGAGARGVVNFPAQDTLYPAGWEAPFANAFYAWDAALALDGNATPRALPTARFGALVRTFGSELAASHVRYDAAIAYLGGSVGTERATNDFFGDLEAQTIVAQRGCRDAGLACALVDPAALDAASLARYPLVIVPYPAGVRPSDATSAVRARFATYAKRGGTLTSALDGAGIARAFAATGRRPEVEGAGDATFAPDPSRRVDGFLSVVNYDASDRVVAGASVGLADGSRVRLPRFVVPRHSAIVVPVGVRLAAFGRGFAASDRLDTDCMPLRTELRAGAIEAVVPAARDDGETRCTMYVRLHGVSRELQVAADGDATRVETVRISTHGVATQTRATQAPSADDASGRIDTIPVRDDTRLPGPSNATGSSTGATQTFAVVSPGTSRAYRRDVYREGTPAIVLDNGLVRLVIAPDAGGRAFVFEDDRGRSIFTTVGALRDDVAVEPPLSTTDRIAKYTHQFPAGTFNRRYDATLEDGTAARVRLRYDAPDVVPAGATFVKSVTLAPGARAFTLTEHVDFHGDPAAAAAQRAVSVNSLSVGAGTDMTTRRVLVPDDSPFLADTDVHVTAGHAIGFYDTATHELATLAWRAGDVEDAAVLERRFSLVARITLARDPIARLRFGYDVAPDVAGARALVAAADAAAQVPD
jgi:amino acid transporter